MKSMLIKFSNLCYEWESANLSLLKLCNRILGFERYAYNERIRRADYNELVCQADFMSGYLLRLEERLHSMCNDLNS
jgi:hypothetical protein